MAVELAFIDEENKRLESRFFPDKIGGLPAWLDLMHLPSVSEIQCDVCGLPRHFLCQLYSSLPKDSAFHRSLFVFVCLSEKCFRFSSNKNFIVFRNQLPRRNSYYPEFAAGIEERTDITCSNFGTHLCAKCGILGELRCDLCDEYFCSIYHRNLHDAHASTGDSLPAKNRPTLLPEYGLCCETEDLSDTASDDSNSEEEQFDEEIAERISSKLCQFSSPQDDAMMEEIFRNCSESSHNETFLKFKTRISHYPDQVLRHSRDNPLWISDQHQPSDDCVPQCDYCGSPREFEFQILPQLLNYLNLDQGGNLQTGIFDWGTLAVYTCKNSCDDGPPYKKEFLWKQDIL